MPFKRGRQDKEIDYSERARKAAATRAAKKRKLEEEAQAAVNDRLAIGLISTGVGDEVRRTSDVSGPSDSARHIDNFGNPVARDVNTETRVVNMCSISNGMFIVVSGIV